ncbi:Potassium-transporting ATPase C chain [compost metagenome]
MLKRIIAVNIFTFLCLVLLSVTYPLFIWGIAQITPGKGKGQLLEQQGKVVGFYHEGQSFTADNYFWGRPSAVNYNGSGSGGSNKGTSNPEYLKEVEHRIDTFLVLHPYLSRKDVPSELVTASGSGLDPNISPKAAMVQVKRVAKARGMDEKQLQKLVKEHTKAPLFKVLGPSIINVLELNLALDNFKTIKN